MDPLLNDRLLDYLQQQSLTSMSDSMSDSIFRYEINVPKDVHWVLVGLAAQNQLHQEEYIEEILAEFVTIQLRRVEKKMKEMEELKDKETEEDNTDAVEELIVGMGSIEAKIESLCDYTSSLVVAITQGLEELKKTIK